MKLQAKFTLSFILFVCITIVISFLLINWNLQSEFDRFVQQRVQNRTLIIERKAMDQIMFIRPVRETPEERFSRTVSDSLILAGIIDVLVAMIFAYFLSNVLLRRIKSLEAAMKQYMKDGQSKAVVHGASDEVDDLATMYNLLIEKIAKEEKIRRDFFVDMSHELRTPLTSVKGYLEGLIDHIFDQTKETEIHTKALNETDRMIYLVKETTSLSKLESDPPELSLEEIDLRSFTVEVRDMFSADIEQKKLSVRIEGGAHVLIDRYKFKQVFINLFDNAIHYSPENAAIVISMEEKEGLISWSIRNPLITQPSFEVEHLFERFYRADKSRKHDAKKPHLGIGLTIVKKIVEQHGGTITARMENEHIVFEILFATKG